jgi:putative Mg2+ transporter-C (MgtC) family protein
VETSCGDLIGATPDLRQMTRVAILLLVALFTGAVMGAQREYWGKAAGLRTHMLVSLGTTIFVVAGVQYGMGEDAMSRVIQGLATGIGFLGAGTILKLGDKREIRGLTTSASIWITAGISVAIGLGQIAIALLGTLLAWIVLSLMVKVENYINRVTDGESADR